MHLAFTIYNNKSRPRALSALKEERLAAKEQIKAATNILQHLGYDFDQCFPRRPLRQIGNGESRFVHNLNGERRDFIVTEAGEAVWDFPDRGDHLRVVFHPDEGSALFAGYEYLAQQGCAVALRRDELLLDMNVRVT